MSYTLAPDPGRDALAHAVFPLDAFYVRAGLSLPSVQLISGDTIPAPFRNLLVHDRDMTSTLEAYHGGPIHIEVLGRERRGDAYFREVVLRLDTDERAVEFGASMISLGLLPPGARKQVLDEHLPIGHILKTHGIAHSGRPSAYFRVEADELMRRSLNLRGVHVLYGRRNTLRDGGGRPFCEVVEILPPSQIFKKL